MSYLLIVVALIVAVLLILIVLVQNSKGGGLASNFTGPTQVMGVRQTSDFLEKGTWTLATVLIVLSIASTVVIASDKPQEEKSIVSSAVETQAEQAIQQPAQETATGVQEQTTTGAQDQAATGTQEQAAQPENQGQQQ